MANKRRRPTRRPKTNLAVRYLRTSSKNQDDENSFQRQRINTDRITRREQLTLVKEFSDVHTGLEIEQRDGVNAMIKYMADETNQISHLILDDLSRLSRDPYFPLQYLAELRKQGIYVITDKEGLINSRQMEIFLMNQAALNYQASRKISLYVKESFRTLIQRGFEPTGNTPFGYKRVQVADEHGHIHCKWLPDGLKAEAIRTLFRTHRQAQSTIPVVKHLNSLPEEKYPRPAIGYWTRGSVLNKLNNKSYTGFLIFGENPSIRFDDDLELPEYEEDQPYIEIANFREPLVSLEEWEESQRIIAKNTRKPTTDEDDAPGVVSPRSIGSPNPLSEVIKCGYCQANMVICGQYADRLMCAIKKNKGKELCQKHNAHLLPTLDFITRELHNRVITEEVIQHQIQLIKASAETEIEAEKRRKQQIQKRLREIEKELNNVQDFIRQKGTSDPRFTNQLSGSMTELLNEREALDSDLYTISEETEEKLAFVTNPTEVAETAMNLKSFLYSQHREEVRTFLRMFIKRVDLYDETLTIHYRLPLPRTQDSHGNYSSSHNIEPKTVLSAQQAKESHSKRTTDTHLLEYQWQGSYSKRTRFTHETQLPRSITRLYIRLEPTPEELEARTQARREANRRAQAKHQAKKIQRERDKYHQKKDAGICIFCNEPSLSTDTLCQIHRDRRRHYDKAARLRRTHAKQFTEDNTWRHFFVKFKDGVGVLFAQDDFLTEFRQAMSAANPKPGPTDQEQLSPWIIKDPTGDEPLRPPTLSMSSYNQADFWSQLHEFAKANP